MNRSFAPTFGAKKEVTVATTATSGTLLLKACSGPTQVRIVNHDTVRVAYRFGDANVTAVLAQDPCLTAGAIEVITVFPPNALAAPNDIYFSVISDSSPAGNKFEACPGTGI